MIKVFIILASTESLTPILLYFLAFLSVLMVYKLCIFHTEQET